MITFLKKITYLPQNDFYVFFTSIFTGIVVLGFFYLYFYFNMFPRFFLKKLIKIKLIELILLRIIIFRKNLKCLLYNNLVKFKKIRE